MGIQNISIYNEHLKGQGNSDSVFQSAYLNIGEKGDCTGDDFKGRGKCFHQF